MNLPISGRASARLQSAPRYGYTRLLAGSIGIFAALRAWFRHAASPPEIPPGLRRDLGLPPVDQPKHWSDFS